MDSTKDPKDDLLGSCASLLEVIAEDAQEREDTATWAMASVMAQKVRTALSEQGEAAQPAAGWRTMDSAPKDGTRVILWMVHQNAAYSDDPIAEGWEAPVFAEWIDHNSGGWTWHGLCGQPTHWRPAPASPGIASQAEEGSE